MKLVKDKVIKLPRSAPTVRGAIRRAQIRAEEEGWNEIIIVGANKKQWRSITSRMKNDTAIALLEKAKIAAIQDEQS